MLDIPEAGFPNESVQDINVSPPTIDRHDARGTAGTAAAVPEFSHCLVGFS